MIIGIYSRKSVFSDKSDSVQTQVNMCKDYIDRLYQNCSYQSIVYDDDEGYSGSNVDRPGYKKMMEDIEKRRVNVIICYKIDRISRDVKDFSNTFDFMQKHDVSFISVKEQIDTTSPLGRAMMYICSVFAQMERETIAERIKDSSLALAKSGKWAGGRPPLGYKRERTVIDGKEHTILVPDPDKIPFLDMIYDTFLQGYSLTGLEKRFREDGVRTLNDSYFSSTQIYLILCNPHVVANAPEIWDFFNKKGCVMIDSRESFDGKHGVMVYGRTNGGSKRTHYSNTADKWIVCSGLHAPIIDAKKWLTVQQRFGLNVINKTRKHEVGILKGIVKCRCGWSMRVQHKVDNIYNKVYDNYFCNNRNRHGSGHCDMRMISVDKMDGKIIDILSSVALDKNALTELAKDSGIVVKKDEKNVIVKKIKFAEQKASKLAASLSENINSAASKYIITEIEKLDANIINLNVMLREISIAEIDRQHELEDLDTKYSNVCLFINKFDNLSYQEKNSFLSELLRECIWDGNTLHVTI